jgi:hypothetical protein
MKKQQFVMTSIVLNGKTYFFSNFDCFSYDLTPFLACWIVITPIWLNIKKLSNFTVLKNESLFN